LRVVSKIIIKNVKNLLMQGDEGRTGGSEENGAEAGRGQTEAHHAAGTLIDRGWQRTNGGSSCSWNAD
jgi:hypothetical protein